ncbi:hypothetical protein DSUL_100042 [Desulfovibrionales bacterium]
MSLHDDSQGQVHREDLLLFCKPLVSGPYDFIKIGKITN